MAYLVIKGDKKDLDIIAKRFRSLPVSFEFADEKKEVEDAKPEVQTGLKKRGPKAKQ